MQIRFSLMPKTPLSLPLNYNYALQSAIYEKLSEVSASDFWHDTGFGAERGFKGFVFGRLSGEHEIHAKRMFFSGRIDFEVRSPKEEFCDALRRAAKNSPSITLLGNTIPIDSVSVSHTAISKDEIEVFCASPVLAVHSGTGKKKLCYAPEDEEFIPFLLRNYERKFEAIYGEKAEQITIACKGEHKKTVTRYKGMWLTGYMGEYRLRGAPRALDFLYQCGLGSKNAQGFGMFELKE